jgi:hypothetical protein
LALRLRPDDNAEQTASAFGAMWLEIAAALTPIIGQRGLEALFRRSLQLMLASPAGLAIVPAPVGASLDPPAWQTLLVQQEASAALAAASIFLQTFYGLLTSLVGSSLTERLLRSIWTHETGRAPAQDKAP